MKNDIVELFSAPAHRLTSEELREYGYFPYTVVYGDFGKCFKVFANPRGDGWEVSVIVNADFGKGFINECSFLCETLETAQKVVLAKIEQKMKLYQTAYNILQARKLRMKPVVEQEFENEPEPFI